MPHPSSPKSPPTQNYSGGQPIPPQVTASKFPSTGPSSSNNCQALGGDSQERTGSLSDANSYAGLVAAISNLRVVGRRVEDEEAWTEDTKPGGGMTEFRVTAFENKLEALFSLCEEVRAEENAALAAILLSGEE